MLLNDETDRIISSMKVKINAREYRSHSRGNQKWTIKRNWQHRHKTQDEDKQSKNTTQYVLDTTMRKQTQIT
jgi:hypothetical protein